MKILYALQATGNGHITRANELVPIFKKHAKVDVLVSGTESSLKLNFNVKYKFKGLSFVFGKRGGISFFHTIRKVNFIRLFIDIWNLKLDDYDLILIDFEPISAWAAKLQNKKAFALSHQYALVNENVPMIKKLSFIHKLILKFYAPVKKGFGFHFAKYDKNIFFPIISKNIRKLKPKVKDHYAIYLPAYSVKKLKKIFTKLNRFNFHIFSKEVKEKVLHKNLTLQPINSKVFSISMANSLGVICGAGFETPAEAIYLKKKLLVIPMKNQFEQKCNAFALKELGYKVTPKLNKTKIENWLKIKEYPTLNYKHNSYEVVEKVLLYHIKTLDNIQILPKNN